jgi:acyl-coenzyme A synthetase/AMP-(fatty) acid ligase
MGMAIVARKTIMQSAAVILAWWAIGVILSVVGAAFS